MRQFWAKSAALLVLNSFALYYCYHYRRGDKQTTLSYDNIYQQFTIRCVVGPSAIC